MNGGPALQQPARSETLYEESMPLGATGGLRLLLPVASVMTVGAVAAFMIFEGFSTAFIVLFIAGFSAAELLMAIFVHRLLRNRFQQVEVTSDELVWTPAPRETQRIQISCIDTVEEEAAGGGRAGVAVSYFDAATNRQRTLTIPSANPAELLASIEWARAGAIEQGSQTRDMPVQA